MRKIAIRLAVAIFTFLIGLSASSLQGWRAPLRVSSCADAFKTDAAGHRLVKARGMLYGSSERKLTFNELECSGDEIAWFEVELDQQFWSDAGNRQLVERLNRLSQGDRMARAEVSLVGELIDAEGEGQTLRPVISVREMHQTGNISLISLVSN